MSVDKQDDVMDKEHEAIRALVRDSADMASELLDFTASKAKDPLLAMTSLLLAAAVFAKSTGMAREDLLAGTAAAFDSLEEVSPHATH
jgi:hypothetical protein